ncbi:VOC family protein [Porphyrobacter sp. GA68]|uniref:VOC family protein n=1 Tax=Porphyrobacter sp. GA68 TaxID=2883480 RepID=UPI001D18F072|nr:VOC family protein [Porphyrobacter sp. GA68]
MKRAALLALALLLLTGCSAFGVEGQRGQGGSFGIMPPAERLPTDVRRATIIVRDMERSLSLYRDVIGLQVNYDTMVETSGVALPAGEPGAKARLVLLNANDPFVGWVGLMQWTDPPLPDPGPYPRQMGPGDVVLVLNTDDVPGRCEKARRVPGVIFTAEPRLQTYPGRNNGPDIRVIGCNFFDPDGILVELNQILD